MPNKGNGNRKNGRKHHDAERKKRRQDFARNNGQNGQGLRGKLKAAFDADPDNGKALASSTGIKLTQLHKMATGAAPIRDDLRPPVECYVEQIAASLENDQPN